MPSRICPYPLNFTFYLLHFTIFKLTTPLLPIFLPVSLVYFHIPIFILYTHLSFCWSHSVLFQRKAFPLLLSVSFLSFLPPTFFPPCLLFMYLSSRPLPSILSHPLLLKNPFPADRDGVPDMCNLVLAPLLILIKLITSVFQGSNRGIHYCTERDWGLLGIWEG